MTRVLQSPTRQRDADIINEQNHPCEVWADMLWALLKELNSKKGQAARTLHKGHVECKRPFCMCFHTSPFISILSQMLQFEQFGGHL